MKSQTTDCPLCCEVCKREAEPGWIETDNNGPIVPCWKCNREQWSIEEDTTEAAIVRDLNREAGIRRGRQHEEKLRGR